MQGSREKQGSTEREPGVKHATNAHGYKGAFGHVGGASQVEGDVATNMLRARFWDKDPGRKNNLS